MPPKFYSCVLLPLVVVYCFKLLSYAIWEKTNEPNLRKWQKTWFQARFWPVWPNFRSRKMVKNLILGLNYAHWAQIPVTIFFLFFFFFFFFQFGFMGNYHYVQYQTKLMIQPWENLVKDGRADRRADGQMAEIDFIGRCPTLSVQK